LYRSRSHGICEVIWEISSHSVGNTSADLADDPVCPSDHTALGCPPTLCVNIDDEGVNNLPEFHFLTGTVSARATVLQIQFCKGTRSYRLSGPRLPGRPATRVVMFSTPRGDWGTYLKLTLLHDGRTIREFALPKRIRRQICSLD